MRSLKKLASGSLRIRSTKDRSDSYRDGLDSAQVALESGVKSGNILFSAYLGGPVSDAQHVELLRRENEALKRQLANTSAVPPNTGATVKKQIAPLIGGANAAAAYEYGCDVCGVSKIDAPALVTLLVLLRDNLSYSTLPLPRDDTSLREYAARMHLLADLDRDGALNEKEFSLLWRNLPISAAASVLGERYGAKGVAPASTFVYGDRNDWCDCRLHPGSPRRHPSAPRLFPLFPFLAPVGASLPSLTVVSRARRTAGWAACRPNSGRSCADRSRQSARPTTAASGASSMRT